MATLEDAAALALALPGVTERLRHGNRTWFVRDKGCRLTAVFTV